VARSVGRVVFAEPGRPIRPEGTGVLISPTLILTNNHVVPDEETAARMGAQFRYEYLDDGRERSPKLYRLDPAAFFCTYEDLDFTVVALAGENGKAPGATYGFVPLIEQTGKVLKGEAINVVHHPGGDRKRVSIRENRLVDEDDLWLRYVSDTRRGSSGAPVFNDQWEMVALHHGGVPQRDPEGRKLARGGVPWTRDMGEDAVVYVGNEGARVSRIVRWLRTCDLTADKRSLLDEALTAGARS
jgi:V8-like Glu-specific endopeptidase